MEVTLEDQQKINTFSQLNTRKHELEDMLRVKAVCLHDNDDRQCCAVHMCGSSDAGTSHIYNSRGSA